VAARIPVRIVDYSPIVIFHGLSGNLLPMTPIVWVMKEGEIRMTHIKQFEPLIVKNVRAERL
jgi:hypothetical protein